MEPKEERGVGSDGAEHVSLMQTHSIPVCFISIFVVHEE